MIVKETIVMKFGEKLRKCRKALKLSQQELAAEAGLGINTISNYEKGHTYPQNRDIYVRLAKILGTDPNYLRNENELTALESASPATDPTAADNLLSLAKILFSSEELSDKEKLSLFRSIQDAFWEGTKV